MVQDDGLLPVGADTLPECLLAGEPVVQRGDAALVGDHPAGHAFYPDTRSYHFLGLVSYFILFESQIPDSAEKGFAALLYTALPLSGHNNYSQ